MEKGCCSPWNLSLYESKLLLENVEKESAKKSFLVRSMNLIFRLKIIFLLACIVMLQNQVYACLIIMLLAQIGFFSVHLIAKRRYGKVFEGWMSFLNYFLIELTITILLIICLGLFLNQAKPSSISSEVVEVEVSKLESAANLVLVILVISSIITEILNMLLEIFQSLKKWVVRRRKQRQLQEAHIFIKTEEQKLPINLKAKLQKSN